MVMETMSESEEQQALFVWARLMQGKYPALKLMYHIPNEGKRSKACAGRMAAEGLKAGVPDICLPAPAGKYHGLYIELKAKGGKISPLQKEWLIALAEQGYVTALCYGWQDAMEIITRYLNGGSRAGE